MKTSNTQSDIEMSQFISTKLCHDLAGVLGAITNSVDFIESENVEMKSKALHLLKTSSSITVHKLLFYRLAYGAGKNHGEADLDEIKKVASDYLSSSKVTLNFHEKYFHINKIFISANIGKLFLCIIQHALLNLIYGGEIKVVVENGNNLNKISVAAIGKSPKINQEKLDILNNVADNDEINVHNCISHFAYKLSKQIDVKLETDTSQENQVAYFILF